MADSELRIVFLDDSGGPSAPPPAPRVPANESSPPPGPPVSPPLAGPPVGASMGSLTANQAAELFDRFGLRPAQVGMPVEQSPPLGPPVGEPKESQHRAGPRAEEPITAEVSEPAPAPKPTREEKPGILERVGRDAVGALGTRIGGAVAGDAGATAGGAAAAEGLAALGPLAAAAGPAAIAVGALAVAAGGAVAGIHMLANEVDKLKELSGPVAGAVAMNDTRQQYAMLRRADRVGHDLAQFERARGEINEKLTDVTTEILNVLLQFFKIAEDAGVVEFTKDALGYLAANGEVTAKGIVLLQQIAERDLPGIVLAGMEFKAAWDKQKAAIEQFFIDSRDKEMTAEDPAIPMLRAQSARIAEQLAAKGRVPAKPLPPPRKPV